MVEHARAVVIGGGVGGTSIAYHLTELGWTDVVLVDRAELTSGSTFHSAGLVGQLRSSVTLTRMMMYGAELYRRLAAETGTDPSWHEVGSLRLASTPERFEELRRQAGWARTFGLPLELITTSEARDLFPLMSTDGVLGAVYLPTDGWLDPSGLAQALAAGARSRGASIRPHTRVLADRRRARPGHRRHRRAPRRAPGDPRRRRRQRRRDVRTRDRPDGRRHRADHPDGPPVPVHRARSRASTPACPQLRDPDNLVYFREEVGGLCMGGYERDPAPWALDGVPPDFNGKLLPPDMDRFGPIMEGAIRRVPAMADAGVSRVINGPEAFTPDNEFILGESEVRGFFVAAGFSAHGIAGAGGIGRQMADLDRRGPAGARPLEDGHPAVRAGLSLAGLHAGAVHRELRDLLRHPLPERGAPVRRVRCGPRRPTSCLPASARPSARSPAGSAPTGSSRTRAAGDESLRPRGWAGHHWSPAIGAEALATRQAAGALRRDIVRQARGRGAGRGRVPRADVRQRHRPAGRLDRLHAAPRPPRRDPGRPQRDPAGARCASCS